MLHFIVRWVHVVSMAFVMGGALLLWSVPAQEEHTVLWAAERYERLFCAALGLLVVTGIGNLGVFGAGLPTTTTAWGTQLTLKLLAVLLFMLFSLLRTLLVAQLAGVHTEVDNTGSSTLIRRLYAGTTLFVIVILLLAVSLAHG